MNLKYLIQHNNHILQILTIKVSELIGLKHEFLEIFSKIIILK